MKQLQHHNCEGTNKQVRSTSTHENRDQARQWLLQVRKQLTGSALSPKVQVQVQVLHHVTELVVLRVLSELKPEMGNVFLYSLDGRVTL